MSEMTQKEREKFLNDQGYFTAEQVAAMLKITVGTLRNRHCDRKNAPPRTPEGLYPMKDFHEWNRKRLQHSLNKAS